MDRLPRQAGSLPHFDYCGTAGPPTSRPVPPMRHIYLDYNTTTPLAAEVQEAMVPFLAEFYGAPSGAHWLARASAEAIEDARSRLATLLGAAREDLVFTGGGPKA